MWLSLLKVSIFLFCADISDLAKNMYSYVHFYCFNVKKPPEPWKIHALMNTAANFDTRHHIPEVWNLLLF